MYHYFLASLCLLYLTFIQLTLTVVPSLTFFIPAEAATFVFSIPLSNLSLTLFDSFGRSPNCLLGSSELLVPPHGLLRVIVLDWYIFTTSRENFSYETKKYIYISWGYGQASLLLCLTI